MKKVILIVSILVLGSLLAFAAAADGTWNFAGNDATAPQQLSLATSGTNLTGTIGGAAISGGMTQANTLWFSATRSGVTYKYKGTINGTKLALYEEQTAGQGRLLNYNHN